MPVIRTVRIFFCFSFAALLLAAGCQSQPPAPPIQGDISTTSPQEQITPVRETVGVTTTPPSGTQMVAGTYTFTIPQTVTLFKRINGTMQQYLLYKGQPTADQTPFMTVTVAPNVQQTTATDPNFQIQGQRTYTLNGLAAQEWTGYTADKAPFTEIILSNSSGGFKLDALAVATDESTRELALSILQSIQWQPVENQ